MMKKSTRGPTKALRRDEPRRGNDHPAGSSVETTSPNLRCKVCGRAFHKSKMLRLHLLTHNVNLNRTHSTTSDASHKDGGDGSGADDEKEYPVLPRGKDSKWWTYEKNHYKCNKCQYSTHSYRKINNHATLHGHRPRRNSVKGHKRARSSPAEDESEYQEEFSSEKEMESSKHFSCIACSDRYDDEALLNEHVLKMHGARLKCLCQICHGKKRSDAGLLMVDEMVKDGDQEVKIFRCLVCKSAFFLGCKCVCHIEQNHNSIILKYPYECANCGKMYETAPQLFDHQQNQHALLEKLSRCGYCKETFKITSYLEDHIRQTHKMTNKFLQTKFEAVTQKLEVIKPHVNPPRTDVVSSSSSYPLPSKTTTTKRNMTAKKSTRGPLPKHTNSSVTSTSGDAIAMIKEYICEICKHQSHSRIGYTNHMIVYHKVKPSDLPFVASKGTQKPLLPKRHHSTGSDDDDDENWRPSRVRANNTPMRSSTRLALAASRKDTGFYSDQYLEEYGDDAAAMDTVDAAAAMDTVDPPVAVAMDTVDESNVTTDAPDNDNVTNTDNDTVDDDKTDNDTIESSNNPDEDDDDAIPNKDVEDESHHSDSDGDDDSNFSSTSQDEDDNSKDGVDDCKNCPGCRQEAAQALAAKLAAANKQCAVIKTEPVDAASEQDPSSVAEQPHQLVIKDVYSLQHSTNHTSHHHHSSTATSAPSTPSPDVADDRCCAKCLERTPVSRCVHCGLMFTDEVMHTIHMGWHGSHDPYECHACGRKCGDKYSFTTHIFREPHL